LNWKTVFGTNQYNLWVKSAITGSNCHVVLYKCGARYDIPCISFREDARPSTVATYGASSTWSPQNVVVNTADVNFAFTCIQNLHTLGWQYKYRANPAVTSSSALAAKSTIWMQHQEGSSLYDNQLWTKMFKIVKSYKAELVPGQMAKLSMKQKPKILNPVKDHIGGNMICKKGQVFFVLKLQGSLGHQDQDDEKQPQSAYFENGPFARPNIGLMPAAVDVMCFKKLQVHIKYKPKTKMKSIYKIGDYYDDESKEEVPADYFIDAAPSDYAASSAIIS